MTTETKYTIKDNYEELEAHFKVQPRFRVMEHCDKFFIQIITPIVQEEYSSLNDIYSYINIKDEYIINNRFDSLEEAKIALNTYITPARVHMIPDYSLRADDNQILERYRILEYNKGFYLQEYFKNNELDGYKNIKDDALVQPYNSLQEALSMLDSYNQQPKIHKA